jgi:hypothetical protein
MAIIAYSAGFEKGRLTELADAFPDLAGRLRDMVARTVDLLTVTLAHWYHRDQRGSWSIKAVLPTVAPELDCARLDVKDGMQAQAAYLEAIDPGTTFRRGAEIDARLWEYCGRDTEAMRLLTARLCDEAQPVIGQQPAAHSSLRRNHERSAQSARLVEQTPLSNVLKQAGHDRTCR